MRTVVVCEVEEVLFTGNFWEPFIRRSIERKCFWKKIFFKLFPWLWAHRSHNARIRFGKNLWKECLTGYAFGHIRESLGLWGLACRLQCRRPLYDRLYQHLRQGDTVYLVSTALEEWTSRLFLCYPPRVLCNKARTFEGMIEEGFEFEDCIGAAAHERFLQHEPDRKSYRLIVYATRRHRELLEEADESYLAKHYFGRQVLKKIKPQPEKNGKPLG